MLFDNLWIKVMDGGDWLKDIFMSIIMSKLPDEPVIISILSIPLHHHPGEVMRLNCEIAKVAQSHPLYHICKINEIEPLSFSDILLWLSEQQEYLPGSINDHHITTILVGDGPLFQIWQKKICQRLGLVIPTYPSVTQALACVRAEGGQSLWNYTFPVKSDDSPASCSH